MPTLNCDTTQDVSQLFFFFFLIPFQFDLPFVEVHRVKAVRFLLPPGDEDGQTGSVEVVSRNGSRQHLSEDGAGRDAARGQKVRCSFLCGLCCTDAPEVSVWNCDGEILSVSEITCRYTSLLFLVTAILFFFLLQCFNGSNCPLRVHAQLVRLYARGIEAANQFGDQC